MNDSVRETFEQDYEELHGIAVPESSFKRDETGNYYDPDIAREWIIWSAAWRANGGEAGEIIHVGFTNPAQIGYAKDESGFFYPDTDNQCYIPLYMLKRHLNRMGHDYTHPAPPSVAVPEQREWNQVTGRDGFKYTEGWNACREAMLTDAPSPDHSGDAGKVAFVDGVGAQRMTAEECKEGIGYIIHGDNIYWPLSDDDELRLIQAACGNGEFTYPQATPSVPENEIKALALEEYADQLDAVFANAQEAGATDCPAWHAGQFAKDARKQAARLRTAGDEGEES